MVSSYNSKNNISVWLSKIQGGFFFDLDWNVVGFVLFIKQANFFSCISRFQHDG